MKSKIVSFLEQFSAISEEDRELIAEKLNHRLCEKGEVLQKEGSIPHFCYFVLSGCVRQYQIEDGLEKTIEFYTEENGAVTSQGFLEQSPSKYTLVCSEETLILQGDPGKDVQMFEEFPVLKDVTRMMMEKAWVEEKENFASFITSSPEERYRNLLNKRPDLLNRVPQHQIASYLGMKPESLSRIRKRISVST